MSFKDGIFLDGNIAGELSLRIESLKFEQYPKEEAVNEGIEYVDNTNDWSGILFYFVILLVDVFIESASTLTEDFYFQICVWNVKIIKLFINTIVLREST